jgi:hypothetical protein
MGPRKIGAAELTERRFAPLSSRHLTTHAFGQQRMPLDKGTADQIVREPASTSC